MYCFDHHWACSYGHYAVSKHLSKGTKLYCASHLLVVKILSVCVISAMVHRLSP